jgi:hypothetical protein
MQSPAAIEITTRFKEAFSRMHQLKGRGMKSDFCRRNQINKDILNLVLAHPDLRALQPCWIAALCRDYGVSTEWVLFGEGDMRIEQ